MGGGGCRKFESFVGNLGGFAPPPEKVNFRHCTDFIYNSYSVCFIMKINRGFLEVNCGREETAI